MRILLDMDGVICNFVEPLIETYNHFTNEGVKLEDITEYSTSKFVKKRGILMGIKDSPGFIRSLKPFPDVIESIELLDEMGHEIVFVSNATNCPTAGHEKREWLKYYFGKRWKKPKLVLTYHKFLVKGDVMLEDSPANLETLDPEVTPLLFHQHYNASEKRFKRIYSWAEFVEWVDEHSN